MSYTSDLIARLRRRSFANGPLREEAANELERVLALLAQAVERLEDVIREDDGQATKEAERFVRDVRTCVPIGARHDATEPT